MKKKFDGATDWNYIIVEGFCGYSFMKSKYLKIYDVLKKNGKLDFASKTKGKMIKNSNYVKDKIPANCTGKIGVECLGARTEKCPFFLCSQAEYDEYLINYIKDMRKYTRSKKRRERK